MSLLDKILGIFRSAPAVPGKAEEPATAKDAAVLGEGEKEQNTVPSAGAEPAAKNADVITDDDADFASHMGEIVPLILEMAEPAEPETEAPAAGKSAEPPAAEGAETPAAAISEPSEVPAAEKEEPPAEADAAPKGSPAPEAPAKAEAAPSEPPTESELAETPPANEQEPAEPTAEAESAPAEPAPEKAEAAEPPSPAGTLRIELPPFRQKRVVVSLLKGGVGKTTITCFLATALQKIWDDAASDGRVLVVDTDPQGSATDFFLEGAPVSPERSLRALFAPYPFPGPELIQHTRYSRIDLIAAHPSMAEVAATADDRLEDHLAWYLANAANDYSLILLDTPPSNTLALRNALMASSGIFMPLDPSRQSLKTFVQFSQTVKRYKDRNRALQIYGVIFSRYDSRQSLDRNIRDTISAQLAGSGLRLYEIPRRAAIADSYNNYTGYEALSPSKEADALRTFHDLAMQVLAR